MANETFLHEALVLHQSGNLDEAERIYREILQGDPADADALHFLGILLFQKKDYDAAVEMINKAIQTDPGNINAYYNLAGVLQDIGQLDEAMTYYRKVIELNPDVADTYNSLGAVLQKKGQLDEAISNFKKALQLNPELAMTHFNLGYALQQKGQLDEAVACYRQALKIKTDFDDAYFNLGVIFQAKGDLDNAMFNYYSALHHNQENFDVHNNIGVIFKKKGQLDGAVSSFRNAISINPHIPELWYNLGNALYDKGEISEAIIAYETALKLDPERVQTCYELGNALKEEGKPDDAISAYDKALSLNPDLFKARWARCLAHLPVIYPDSADIEKARKKYSEELLKLKEDISFSSENKVDALEEAVGAHQPFYLAAQGLVDAELQRIYGNFVCSIMSAKYPGWAKAPEIPPLQTDEPIRIGVVSGYYYHHSNWKLPIRGWVENIDRKKFTLYGYYTGRIKDKETESAQSCFNKFVNDVFSFETLCEKIREDKLHILIFPEIGMDPMTLKLASLKLAPVQCTSWGHPDTSGLPSIDYYISSNLMEPDDADSHYTEKLVRLPNLSVYYKTPEHVRSDVTRSSFGFKEESILYLCSHALFTHLPQYDELYTRIAKEAGDCLFIFISHESSTVTEQFHARIKKAFESSGLEPDKYVKMLPILEPSRYQALNCIADVFLDTPGWSAANSTFEAIACNLPVVTLPGKLMRQRHCSAILQMMGMTETIARTADEYVGLAVRLGKEPEYRRQIKEKIDANKYKLYEDRECITGLEEFIEKIVRR